MKWLLVSIFTSMVVLKASGNAVSIPAIYVGPRHQKNSVHTPFYSRLMSGRLRPKHILNRRVISSRRTVPFNQPRIHHILTSEQYPAAGYYTSAMRVAHPSLTRRQNLGSRYTRRFYQPAALRPVLRTNRLRHSRNKSLGYGMLSSLMESSRQRCFWKHQQPQLYALLEAALDSMQNYTVVQVHYGMVFLYKRCDWARCLPHKYEMNLEFTTAPSNGCDWKKSCGCSVQSNVTKITCKANGTSFQQSEKINNLTLVCDNGLAVKLTKLSSTFKEKNNKLTDHVGIVTSEGEVNGTIESGISSNHDVNVDQQKTPSVGLLLDDEHHREH